MGLSAAAAAGSSHSTSSPRLRCIAIRSRAAATWSGVNAGMKYPCSVKPESIPSSSG